MQVLPGSAQRHAVYGNDAGDRAGPPATCQLRGFHPLPRPVHAPRQQQVSLNVPDTPPLPSVITTMELLHMQQLLTNVQNEFINFNPVMMLRSAVKRTCTRKCKAYR